MAAKQTANSRDVSSELVYLAKALKAPASRDAATRLAEQARDEVGAARSIWSPACSGRSRLAIRMAPRDAPGQSASPPASHCRTSTSSTSASGPARPATGWPSPSPPSGWPAWPKHIKWAGSAMSRPVWVASC